MSEKTTQYNYTTNMASYDEYLRPAREALESTRVADREGAPEFSAEHPFGFGRKSLLTPQDASSADDEETLVLRKIRTAIARMPASSTVTDMERMEEATEIEAQKLFEAQQRFDTLTKNLNKRGDEWYIQLLVAAKEIYPAKELPIKGKIKRRSYGGTYDQQDHGIDYTFDYNTRKINGERRASEVNSLKIRSDYPFSIDFNCHDGSVDEIILRLPPLGERRVYLKELVGGPLGEMISRVSERRYEANRIKFLLKNSPEAAAAMITNERRTITTVGRKTTRHSYDAESDSFKDQSNPGDNSQLSGVNAEKFLQVIDQLYDLIPSDNIRH